MVVFPKPERNRFNGQNGGQKKTPIIAWTQNTHSFHIILTRKDRNMETIIQG
jgi:hypothetical protein